jgi:hypothetical protein
MNNKVLLGIIAGLLVVVAIGVVIVINQLAAADRQADYERCLAANGVTAENAADDLDAAFEASELCAD